MRYPRRRVRRERRKRKIRMRKAEHPASLPEDPGEEALPVAQPEPMPRSGVPVQWKADRETWSGRIATLYGVTDFHYRDYVLSADKMIYNQETSELTAEGHVRMSGGPADVVLTASHGDMRLNMHTARFYDATGTAGIRRAGRAIVYSTANPFLFSARVVLETGQGKYRIIDGTMTNCRLPKPDWQLLSRHIDVADGPRIDNQHHLQIVRRAHLRSALPAPSHRRERAGKRFADTGDQQRLIDSRLHVWRAGIPGAQSQHGHGDRQRVLQPARAGRPTAIFATRVRGWTI